MTRCVGHLVSSVLEQAKVFRPLPPCRYSSLWEFRAKLSMQPTIINSKTARTTSPSRRMMRPGSAYAWDSSLYPAQSTAKRPTTRLSAGSVHVTILQVSKIIVKQHYEQYQRFAAQLRNVVVSGCHRAVA